jgi:DNA-binding transcriptional MerR regulator
MDGTWTIGELAELAAAALAADPAPPVNGRITPVPNDRLIRWYRTVGLVDPPLSRTGRIASYGRRHLLQLVAVKRRQADGAPLAQIQAELIGAPDAYLESVAKLPEPGGPGTARTAATARTEPPGQPAPADEFWRRRPASHGAAATAASLQPDSAAEFVHGIRLAPGVLLVLDADAPGLVPAAAAAIRSAAAPLIETLTRYGYTTATDADERNQP